MKKIFIISIVLLLLGTFSAFSQSTIYLMYDVQFWNQTTPFKINGENAFLMAGDAKRIGASVLYTRNKRKCTIYREGKIILSFDFKATIPSTGAVIPFSDEIQLNLSPGSVHYLRVKPIMKGNKLAFEELSEEDGKKEFANKKYTDLPDYVEVKK